MDSMSDFVASAVEFIVGGILFTIAVAFLVVTIAHPGSWPEMSQAQMDFVSANSTVLGIVFIAAAYAAGVVGESVARSSVELLLDRETVRSDAFQDPPPHVRPKKKAAKPAPRPTRWQQLKTYLTERALGDDYTVAQLKVARDERERQRAVVMRHEQLHSEVQGQLKRLRLERVFTLSLAITTVALGLRGDWSLFAITLVASVWGVWLVNTRFKRYCGSIARNHYLVDEQGVTEASASSSQSPA